MFHSEASDYTCWYEMYVAGLFFRTVFLFVQFFSWATCQLTMIVLANHSYNLKLDVENTEWILENTVIMERVALQVLLVRNFGKTWQYFYLQWDWITCSLVGLDVSIFCFPFLHCMEAISPITHVKHYVWKSSSLSVVDELSMVLSYQMNKNMRGFVMNWILKA